MHLECSDFQIYKKIDNESLEKLTYKKNCRNITNIWDFLVGHEYIRPAVIRIETVNYCNYSCIFCAKQKMTREKKIMSLELFEKIILDYLEMGGGHISLTPQIGEIFLDPLLIARMKIIDKYYKKISLSITTNAVNSLKYSESDLIEILKRLKRVHISLYGLDDKEHQSIVGVDDYKEVIHSVNRIISLAPKKVAIGFRLLKEQSITTLENWININFNSLIPFGFTTEYCTMGGILDDSIALPYDARWKSKVDKSDVCISPIFGLRIFSDGSVSFCCAGDPDNSDIFKIGDVNSQKLGDIYHSKKVQILQMNKSINCKKCNYYRPFKDERSNVNHWIENPIDFIGG